MSNFLDNKLWYRRSIASLILPCCLIFSLIAEGVAQTDELKPTPEEIQRLNSSLSEKLRSLGSFKAEYLLTKKDAQPIRFNILLNSRHKYILLELFQRGTVEPDFVGMLNYASGIELLFISPSNRTATKYSFTQLFESTDHPFGILLSGLQEICKKKGSEPVRIDVSSAAPSIDLKLTENEFLFELGIKSFPPFSTSWLETDTLAKAEYIEETDLKTTINYSKIHKVIIDNKTGLLLEDIWRQPDQEQPRKLSLENFAKIKNERPFDEYLSYYNELSIKYGPLDDVMDQFYVQFLIALGKSLNSREDFEEMLVAEKEGICKGTCEFSRSYYLKVFRQDINSGKSVPGVKEFAPGMIPLYKEFMQIYSGKEKISFKKFLQMAKSSEEMRSGFLEAWKEEGKIDLETFFEKLEHDKYLLQVPEEQRKPLLRLLECAKSSIVDGYLLAYIDILFEYAEEYYSNIERPTD